MQSYVADFFELECMFDKVSWSDRDASKRCSRQWLPPEQPLVTIIPIVHCTLWPTAFEDFALFGLRKSVLCFRETEFCGQRQTGEK